MIVRMVTVTRGRLQGDGVGSRDQVLVCLGPLPPSPHGGTDKLLTPIFVGTSCAPSSATVITRLVHPHHHNCPSSVPPSASTITIVHQPWAALWSPRGRACQRRPSRAQPPFGWPATCRQQHSGAEIRPLCCGRKANQDDDVNADEFHVCIFALWTCKFRCGSSASSRCLFSNVFRRTL